jgi:hypothetical protein
MDDTVRLGRKHEETPITLTVTSMMQQSKKIHLRRQYLYLNFAPPRKSKVKFLGAIQELILHK